MKSLAVFCFCLTAFLAGCRQPQTTIDTQTTPDTGMEQMPAGGKKDSAGQKPAPIYVGRMDSALLSRSNDVLRCLKEKKYDALAAFIHPKDGIRFSPYAHIDTSNDVHLSADKFTTAARQSKKLNWGSFDGTGENITLDIDKYFDRFVYDADFLKAEKIGINDMIGGGNSLNNLEQVYAGLPYVEYYFPGFEKKFGDMDWRCLRLVYKKHGDGYLYLVGVVHDEWTI